jgi:hypothetical protein
MQTTSFVQDVEAGAQVEVVRIAEDDLGLHIVGKVALLHRLHGASRPDRHENGCFNSAVVGVYYTSAGFGMRVVGY